VLKAARPLLVAAGLLLGLASHQAVAALLTDNFLVPHNYLTQGVSGSIWDGVFDGGATVTAAAASISTLGYLTFQSSGGYWESNGTGLLLYILATGDFTATVHVASADYPASSVHDVGLMARAPDLADAGDGEDWVGPRYFVAGGFNSFRTTDNGGSDNYDASGLEAWLQLERSGDWFYVSRKAASGDPFVPFSSIYRPDLAGLTLQVGIWQATFSSSAGALFDNFSLATSGTSAIPEPATIWLSAFGVAVVAILRKRHAG
jgi:hypothetical protein